MAKSKKTTRKNKLLPLLLAAAVITAAAVAALVFPGGRTGAETIHEGESLTIPAAEVTETAGFYPVLVDGVKMEVLAIRDSAGAIRTAFNTCQSCYTSGKGYYKADGTELVCQNCGFRFTAEEVQVPGGGGCNPYPIFPENKTETADAISISYDFLRESSGIFARWKS